MDQTEYETAAGCMVAAGELARQCRDELLARVGVVFYRREPWLQAGKYVRALTTHLPRKNGWQIAEWVGDATPDKTQRLLDHAVWDEHAAIGVVAGFVAERLAVTDDPLAVVVFDESGQEKKGTSTCGVKRQYVGCAGRVSNAVNVVCATLASHSGHALAAARPYLPREWADDDQRRARAKVPDEVVFKTKPALAAEDPDFGRAVLRRPLPGYVPTLEAQQVLRDIILAATGAGGGQARAREGVREAGDPACFPW